MKFDRKQSFLSAMLSLFTRQRASLRWVVERVLRGSVALGRKLRLRLPAAPLHTLAHASGTVWGDIFSVEKYRIP